VKRAGNLYPAIAEPDNLRLAFWRAARGKHDRAEVVAFGRDLDGNISRMRGQLLRGEPDVGHYRFFRVHDPKPRAICAACFSERVLHHAIMNIVEPLLERRAIFDTYACRPGKGNRRAVARARHFARQYSWYLQLDIRKYFDSIDHALLLAQLARICKDRDVLGLFSRLLATYHTAPGKGLPIGNLVSQHLANFHLGQFDRWIKEERRVKGYLRYMDDILLFGPDRESLLRELAEVRAWLSRTLGLELQPKVRLNRCSLGCTFLGFRILPDAVRLSGRGKRRFRRKFRQYEAWFRDGRWSKAALIRHMEPLVDCTRVADAAGFRRKIIGIQEE